MTCVRTPRWSMLLRSLALRLSSQYGGEPDEAAFLASVDRGLEPPRGTGERCWVLDPIDGTKGFMTGKYICATRAVDPFEARP